MSLYICFAVLNPALTITFTVPKLLQSQPTTAKSDCEVTISASKAKELGVSSGDAVVLIGRRRKASYAIVNVSKKAKKESCKVSANLAANLKLRSEDKVKVVPLAAGETDQSRSGDLLLLTKSQVPSVESVTLSPIEDSLNELVAAEGGDEISDEEIQERFVTPYMEGMDGAVLKQGHVIRLRDENGKKLEFLVSHVDIGGGEAEEEEAGKQYCVYYSVVRTKKSP